MVSAYDSRILGPLFGDPDTARLFEDAAAVRAMAEAEAALARAEAGLGIVPVEAARRITEAAASFAADLDALGVGTEQSGVPVIEFVRQFRAHVGGDAAQWVHWGATSQDIVDTALVLQLRDALAVIAGRLDRVIAGLAALADAHRGTVMAARTRYQQALPTSFGLKCAGWLLPLVRCRERLPALRLRLLAVQFGGAAGTLAALDDRGVAVMEAMAAELDLACPAGPWHAQRDGIAEFGSWLSLVTGALGKLGQDAVLLAQTEVGEIDESAGGDRGGSSTMPQKANPVTGEALAAAARLTAGLLGTLHQAQIQEHERGGVGWQMEWATLPTMVVATGSALAKTEALLGRLTVSADRMRANLGPGDGLILAEAATFALAAHMPRPAAQAVVKEAARAVIAGGGHLVDALRERTEAAVDWDRLRDPACYLGSNDLLIDRALAAARG
ncbi:3-carboxy-cis,cis-muconate cycloisomerase [Thalassobaculum sp.]|uniref:3-carboxy-cis,cis-muconate cycloisomerase n=1 Tax=Thalassobaculum sp. TaxID=2022740 RepID=UPI0032EDC404